jgi:hypothetical protein
MMSEMTEKEFWAIWQNNVPPPPPVTEYRLYHDENGFPLFYSTEDLPGLYITIDQETYLNSPKFIRVIDGKIVQAQICWTKKIIPSMQGQSCDPWDVCVIVDKEQPHINWRLKHKDPEYDPN